MPPSSEAAITPAAKAIFACSMPRKFAARRSVPTSIAGREPFSDTARQPRNSALAPCRPLGHCRGMWLLYQFPLCPFSRKVRFLMAEKGLTYELARETPWAPSDEFLDLNPAGTTPVLIDQANGATLIDSQA